MESIKKFEKLTIGDMQNITGGMTMVSAAMTMPMAMAMPNSMLISNDLLIPTDLFIEQDAGVKQWVPVGEQTRIPIECPPEAIRLYPGVECFRTTQTYNYVNKAGKVFATETRAD